MVVMMWKLMASIATNDRLGAVWQCPLKDIASHLKMAVASHWLAFCRNAATTALFDRCCFTNQPAFKTLGVAMQQMSPRNCSLIVKRYRGGWTGLEVHL